MMRPIPPVATAIVLIAVAAMVSLGVWQLDRRQEKAAALAVYAANLGQPPVAFPRYGTGDDLLFRKSGLMCLRPLAWRAESGRGAGGTRGWRQIAECATGAEGPGMPVQIGIATSAAHPAWRGGRVTGWISHAPDHRALIAGLFDRTPKRLMLVADPPAAGLAANAPPDLSAVPNNHLAYAVQWFAFAGVALIIYALALRRIARSSIPPPGTP